MAAQDTARALIPIIPEPSHVKDAESRPRTG
jgi:hypothetical protein